MPTIRKLQTEDLQRPSKKGESARSRTAREYDALLADFSLGEYGEAGFDEGVGENKLTVRNRLRAAAQRRHLDLKFLRAFGESIRFQVIDPSDRERRAKKDTGHPEEEQQLQQQEQAEGPEETKPSRRRRKEQTVQETQS